MSYLAKRSDVLFIFESNWRCVTNFNLCLIFDCGIFLRRKHFLLCVYVCASDNRTTYSLTLIIYSCKRLIPLRWRMHTLLKTKIRDFSLSRHARWNEGKSSMGNEWVLWNLEFRFLPINNVEITKIITLLYLALLFIYRWRVLRGNLKDFWLKYPITNIYTWNLQFTILLYYTCL